jgi:TM2 domain-containing membrane protein YozV
MEEEKTKYCPHCGTLIPFQEAYCPLCGNPQPNLQGMMKPIPKKNPWLAFILSFLITGLGQLYLKNYGRAAVFFGGTIIIGVILSVYFTYDHVMYFGVFMAFISAWDAYRLANKINE